MWDGSGRLRAEPSPVHHQAPILDDLDALARQRLGDGVVPDPELEPDGGRALGQQVVEVGRDVTWEALEDEFDAVFLGLGLGPDSPLGLPGETLDGIWGATRLIAAIKTGREPAPDLGRVRAAVVIGGTSIFSLKRAM